MSGTFNILMVGALLCVLMMLVLASLPRGGMEGVREWMLANMLACIALVLHAFGRELPYAIAGELANGVYAAAGAAILAGFRRFFHRKARWSVLGAGGVAAVIAAIAFFHGSVDSFALRTVAVVLFQSAVCLCIGATILQSRKAWRSRYPYLFSVAMAALIALGQALRAAVFLMHPDELTALSQPSQWDLFFVSVDTFVLPVLTFGAVMMAHDAMLEKAEHAANRDFLTGAWSRRAFFDIAEREMLRSQRNGRNLSLLLLDVDHFKRINDTSGHAAGDQVLIDVVLRAETVIRGVDYFARIGGEEFAVLLPETNRAAALVVAERLRKTLERQAATISSGVAYTVSIGVAVLRGPESYHDLMRRADAALYAAKATGRNRVVCESD